MKIGKEMVVLVGALAVLGWLVPGSVSVERRGARRGDAPDFVHHPAPDASRALPDEPSAARGAELRRELFSPPRDTRPLPPLEFEPPPLPPLAALRPPPSPGPEPARYGAFLRIAAAVREVPGLFAGEEVAEEEVEPEEPEAAASSAAPAHGRAQELSPEERSERASGWMKVYDWIRIVDLKFGQIRNADRFALPKNAEPIQFVEFDPVAGHEKFNGQVVAYERSRVTEFGFADTVANRIELRRREFGDPLAVGEYDEALEFGRFCIQSRLETPRALRVAEEMFTRAAAIARDDPTPRIGLARCHEAAFEFEKAFDEYQALLAAGHARDPIVLVPLAVLEARFRLFGRAEERLVEAERYGRTTWFVQAALGRFLATRGRYAEAVEHLRLANQHEPSGPEFKLDRAALRADLGAALLAVGEVEEAASWMRKGLQADPESQRSVAGLVSIDLLARPGASGGTNGAPSRPAAPESAGFELLLATGLADLDRKAFDTAKQNLLLAAEADPLRAGLAWRALSWEAEVTGFPDEALRFVEMAIENVPDDVWSLYQRGRVLAARDDLEAAFESFRGALDQELDLPDALAAMGEIAERRGDLPGAERYFERALALDPKLVPVHVLRGVGFLEQGDVASAETSFRAALALDAAEPAAQACLAWCFYRKGDADEAIVRLRELDDGRRTLPEEDPYRSYARAQIARLSDHLEKVAWTDRFERRALRNNWSVEESAGPTVALTDGAVRIAGTFKLSGRSRLWQVKPAGDFVAFEAKITVLPESSARSGIFVSRERARRGETQVESEVTISRHPLEGVTQTRILARAGEEAPQVNATGFDWPVGRPVTLRIERTGDAAEGGLRVLIDGFPVVDEERVSTLGRAATELRVGAFAEGDAGRQAAVIVDDVEIVYRKR